ncbi:MAG: hypothetical protein PUH16_03410 [Clostridiales bacterium]|nr:hypothetical protein [Clostridiales bacterium]MDY2721860.1 hypothetical protein [Eubacteriales bacterium]
MNKMQKLTCAKVLKVIFYLLGFPLLMLFVAKDSMIFFNEGAFSETAKNGITAALVLWAGFTLLQIGLYLVLKKQQAVRTIILVVLAVALMLAPIAGLDIRNEKELDKIRTEYSDKGVKVENYSLQKQWFNAISANKRTSGYAYKLNDRVDNVIRTYGLSEYYPKMYRERTQLNTAVAYYQVGGLDGEMIKVTGDNIDGLFDSLQSQSPYAYNPNGLLYDGYIFGVENALELLIKYNEYAKLTVYRPTKYTVADYAEAFNAGCYVIKDGAYVTMKAAGETFSKQPGTIYYESLSIADAYKKMVSEIEESATNASAYESDAWYNYTNDITEILDTRTGKMTNYSTLRIEEDNYRLTDSRLNAVLGTLFEYLGMNPAINKLLDSLKAQQLLDLVNSLLKDNDADLSSGDIGNVVSQLLYGYNNGKGGETTGLALPAQYLFGNLDFTSKEVYKSTGKNAFKVGATADEVVYVTTYTDTGEVNDDGTPVLTAKITREAFDNATMKQLPKTSAEIVPGQKYTTGDTYAKTKLGTAYTAYKTKLESDNKNPNTAALVDIIKSLQPALGLVGGLLDLNDIIGGLVPGLDVAGILKAIAPDLDLNAILTQVLGKIDLTGVTVEGVQKLLDTVLGELSFYSHPLLKKCWQSDFVSDTDKALATTAGTTVDMSDYAWVKYTCEDFGITSGCALVAKGGLLTGKTIGNGTSADAAISLADCYQLQADIAYQPDMYPLLAARRYFSIWAGILAMSIFLSTYFHNKEKLYAYEIALNGGEY